VPVLFLRLMEWLQTLFLLKIVFCCEGGVFENPFDIRRNAVLIIGKVSWSGEALEFLDGEFCR